MAKHAAKLARLTVVRVEDVPIKEVSGVCLRRGPDGVMALVAIGDRVATAAWVVLPGDDRSPLTWQTVDLTGLPDADLPAQDPQLEAVCADGAGRVLLLQETPPRAVLIDPPTRSVVATIALEIGAGHPLADAWDDPGGSQGEGVVLLANGHMLVAKEKDPSAFIEFGPAAEVASGIVDGAILADGVAWPVEPGFHTFVPLATWMPDPGLAATCRDLSDLEVGPDGRLYVLSDKSASLARLGPLAPGGGQASAETAWSLGKVKGKPEGLAFTRNGRAVVALDTTRANANILLFDPPVAGAD